MTFPVSSVGRIVGGEAGDSVGNSDDDDNDDDVDVDDDDDDDMVLLPTSVVGSVTGKVEGVASGLGGNVQIETTEPVASITSTTETVSTMTTTSGPLSSRLCRVVVVGLCLSW